MEFIKETDTYIIESKCLFSGVDRSSIQDFYGPIVGNDASALYLYLSNNIDEKGVFEDLFLHVSLNQRAFLQARRVLEALSLIKTYKKSNNYKFIIYNPKWPNDFLNDIMLKGLLIHAIGESRVDALTKKYAKVIDTDGYENITACFADVYSGVLNDDCFTMATGKSNDVLGRQNPSISLTFDKSLFGSCLKENGLFDLSCLSEEEIASISTLSNLYGLSEDIMSSIVADVYNPFAPIGERVDTSKLKDKCYFLQTFSHVKGKKSNAKPLKSRKPLADKINLMESKSPIEYLKLKQNNVTPVKADTNLLYRLKNNLGLTDGATNALIDYVLDTNNNVLNSSFVEKIAASIVRNEITTAQDTMDFLLNKKSNKKPNKVTTKKTLNENSYKENDSISLEELKKLMEEAVK